ncbi:MAG: hypothetical protein RLZZ385_1498 [Pseudomonadota bacterium]|jgi:hypothetical protein
MTRFPLPKLLLALIAGLLAATAHGHGSVVEEGDVCYIEFGFYSAHFTIYQPGRSRYTEFCEDIPAVGESIFVMEYLHDSLRQVPVDFRIIRDRQNRGRFVRWEDIQAMGDLEQYTEFYTPARLEPDGSFMVLHRFLEAGDYIGIVNTRHPTEDITYHAVFPFHVGPTYWGYWPWIIALLLFAQVNYWLMNGGFARWRGHQAPGQQPQPRRTA